MTIIKLKGGLGNQLFQYAFGRLIAISRNEELFLDKDILGQKGDTYRSYGLDCFKIKAGIANFSDILKYKYPLGIISKAWRFFKAKFLRIFHIGYETRMLQTKSQYLDGFFQSYKYLELIKEELLAEIVLKDGFSINTQRYLAMMSEGQSVALHVRRGDYVNNKETSKAHFVCDLNYYNQAIALMESKLGNNLKFYVFSDDIDWCKESFKGEKFVFVSNLGDCQELMLMSKANHNIISNSSFSFWSAWLNVNENKVVISPSIWNKRYIKAYCQLLPNNWVKI